MTDVTRKVTIQLDVKMTGKPLRLPPPDTTAAKKALDETQRDADRVFANIARQSAANSSQFSRHVASGGLGGVANPALLAQQGEAYKRAGEGVFHLARGIALLNADSDEELAAVVKRIAYYQGLFDIFKGGTDIVSGLTDSYRKLRAAQLVGAGGQAVGIGAGAAATAPIALTLAAVAAALAVGYTAWRKYGGIAEEESRRAQAAMEAQSRAARTLLYDLNAVRGAQRQTRNFSRDLGTSNDIADFRMGLQGDVNSNPAAILAQQQKTRALMLKAALEQSNIRNKDEFIGQGVGLGVNAFADGNRNQLAPGMANKLAADLKSFEELKRRLKEQATGTRTRQADIDRAERAHDDAAANPNDKAKQALAASTRQQALLVLERQKALGETITAGLNNQVASAKQYTAALQAQRSALQANLDTQLSSLKAIKDAIRVEQDARKTVAQRFGAESPFQQQRILEVNKRIKAVGIEGLQPGEKQFARESGYFENKFSRHDLKAGYAAGFGELEPTVFAPGTTGLQPGQGKDEDTLSFLNREKSTTTAGLANMAGKMQEVTKQLESGADKVVAALEELNVFGKMADKVNDLKANVERAIDSVDTKITLTNSKHDKLAGDVHYSWMARH